MENKTYVDIVKVDKEGKIDVPMNLWKLLDIKDDDHIRFEMGEDNTFSITKVD